MAAPGVGASDLQPSDGSSMREVRTSRGSFATCIAFSVTNWVWKGPRSCCRSGFPWIDLVGAWGEGAMADERDASAGDPALQRTIVGWW